MRHLRPIGSLVGDQRGVTGLETAIILIAFVVVASVFAFTVLSIGIFSAEKGKETIHAGLREARSSLQLKGSVTAKGVADISLSTGDSAWTRVSTSTGTSTAAYSANVTADSIDKKEGTASADIVIEATSTTGLVAYENLSSTVDLRELDSLQLWIKYSTTTVAGDLEIVLDDTAGCSSPLENIDLPALVGDAWKLATLGITDNSDMNLVKCVGLSLIADDGAQTANIDEVTMRGQATSIVLTLANALQGEPVDVTEPSDSNNDGLSDSDSTHTLVITYNDTDQIAKNIYWTTAFVGDNDGDDLLESGEKAEITVILKGLATTTPVVKDVTWDIEIRPEDGGVVVVERTMPDRIDKVMNLN